MEITGTSSGTKVDVNADRAMLVEVRPPAFGSLGVYNNAMNTGSIAATLGANSDLWSLRWTDATRLCLIRKLSVSAVVNAAITTGVQFDLAAFFARSFTVSDSNANSSTTATTSGSNDTLRTSMGTSLIAANDIRIAGTGGFTAGTRTLDTNPLGRILGWTGTAAGTFIFNSTGLIPLIDRTGAGQMPVVLAQNEGIVIRNPVAGPATGTFVITVNVDWQEAASY